ncbi:MAG TPA: exodeoxyribonuclease III [Mycobacteriales bacterium]|jgi:exodeoxyribonuclease-3|nr:exodeoxyribonuclease III [Mycobacteriales bacterium]
MRLATWNVNSVVSRLPRLLEWLDLAEPDVVCLQETKVAADAFPAEAVIERGYEVAAHGQGRWNGVAILSRIGLDDVRQGFPGQPGFAANQEPEDASLFPAAPAPLIEARAVGARCGPLQVWSLYVPNGRSPADPHYLYKLSWLDAFREAVAAEAAGDAPFVACGDFNVAPTDDDVWDPAAFTDATHVTVPERTALRQLRELGLTDIVPRPLKYDRPYTYWDYRAGMFHKNFGMRIDLVYANAVVAEAVTDAYVDREARKGKSPSDHAPVVVDVNLTLGE